MVCLEVFSVPLPGPLEKGCGPFLVSCEHPPLSNPSGGADSDRADRGRFTLLEGGEMQCSVH